VKDLGENLSPFLHLGYVARP